MPFGLLAAELGDTGVSVGSMYIRMGSFNVVEGRFAELQALYASECVPVVRTAPGNIDAYVLEPVAGTDPVIVCTVWHDEAAASAYEESGTAKDVVAKVRHLFAGPPTLRSYRK
ncbi:MAG TPA: antibiotic biosynthesis monooxygenase [Kofleriaceae bacterium]